MTPFTLTTCEPDNSRKQISLFESSLHNDVYNSWLKELLTMIHFTKNVEIIFIQQSETVVWNQYKYHISITTSTLFPYNG